MPEENFETVWPGAIRKKESECKDAGLQQPCRHFTMIIYECKHLYSRDRHDKQRKWDIVCGLFIYCWVAVVLSLVGLDTKQEGSIVL